MIANSNGIGRDRSEGDAVAAELRAAPRSLTLFLSHGKSLLWWQTTGIFSREILLYLHFLRQGMFDRINIFSYDAADRDFVRRLAEDDPAFTGIEILAPRNGWARGVKALLWGCWGPVRHRRAIGRSLAVKTNQIDSALAPLLASWLTGRPLVLRMGYLLSRNYRKAGHTLRAPLAAALERLGFSAARRILVSATDLAEMLGANPATRDKTVLTPTYVDVAAFSAKTDYRFDEPLIAVGRLARPKNLENLLLGASLAGRDVVLIGSGELEARLREVAAGLPIQVEFAGQVPNEQLASRLRSHSVFILPSLYEGLPKVLIEAMASGLICIGSRIPGITDLIGDGENGYLIDGFEPEAIAATIRRAFAERNPEIGRRARATVEDAFSLERYAAREAGIYASITG